jgi:hypothetical protein
MVTALAHHVAAGLCIYGQRVVALPRTDGDRYWPKNGCSSPPAVGSAAEPLTVAVVGGREDLIAGEADEVALADEPLVAVPGQRL